MHLVYLTLLIGLTFAEDDLKPFKLEETYHWPKEKFLPTWITDTNICYHDPDTNTLVSFDVSRNLTKLVVPTSLWEKYLPRSFDFSSDGSYLLVRYENDTKIDFRQPWLRPSRYVIYSIYTNSYLEVDPRSYLQYATWVPRHHTIVYVKENNIYWFNLDVKTDIFVVTKDGVPGSVFNGVSNLIYKEFLPKRQNGIGAAAESLGLLHFSPDGTQLVYLRIDERNVSNAHIPYFGPPGDPRNLYEGEFTIKYSKPGGLMMNVSVHHYNLTNSATKMIASTTKGKEIVREVTWISNKVVQIVFLNRAQNESVMELCYIDSTWSVYPCRKVSEEKNKKGWARDDPVRFSADGERYLTRVRQRSGRKKFYHLHVTYKNGYKTFLTRGNYMVERIVAWDEERRIVYYQSSKPDEPSTSHVYGVREVGKEKPTCITCRMVSPEGIPCKVATLEFNREFTHFIGSCYGPAPPVLAVYKNTPLYRRAELRPPVKILENNADMRVLLRTKILPRVVDLKVKVADNMDAKVRLLVPPDISLNGDEKYPLLIQVNDHPEEVLIRDECVIDWKLYLTTNLKVVYGLIDGRGTGRKGTGMLFAAYRALGTVDVQDQVAVTRYLVKNLSFIDASRVGIWGEGYGGWLATKVLESDRGGVFSCGVAVSPITDWMYHNSFVAERYLSTPEDNEEGYVAASLLYDAHRMVNKSFLLMHATADMTVLPQNSMQFAKVLQGRGVQFEQEVYPDWTHSILNDNLHGYRKMDLFWQRCFDLN